MKKYHKTIGIISILFMLLVYVLYSYINGGREELKKNDKESIFVEEEKEVLKVSTKKIVVEIKGEIQKPNIYYMDENSIINDLITMAGGLTENAMIENINRAELLTDHQCIVIPNKNQIEVSGTVSSSNIGNSATEGKVNINSGTLEELDTLPGIGPSKAADIISYRESNGRFNSIEDIKNVKGIGDASYEKLKEKITI